MIPFVPNDKYDILGLKKCWLYVKENVLDIEILYFGELATKTYELFLSYNKEENMPKEFIILISALAQLETVGECEKYSTPDIIKEIAISLLHGLLEGFKLTQNVESKKMEFNDNVFGMSYNNDWYQLDTKVFDITPIINKQSIKI